MCVAMLLRNLVQPEWVTIDCNLQCTTHMLCTTDMTDIHKSVSENLTKPASVIYDKSCIFKEKMCYIFLFTTNGQKFGNIHEMFPFDTNNKTISFFEFLFDAISGNFPPIFESDFKSIIAYTRQSNAVYKEQIQIYSYRKEHINNMDKIAGIFINIRKSVRKHVGGNTFRCQNGSYISITFVCDGENDCQEENPLDETDCLCNTSALSGTEKWTSIFHNKLAFSCPQYQGSSIKFLQLFTAEPRIISKGKQQSYMEGSVSSLVSVHHAASNALSFCLDLSQIPCEKGFLTCYNISDICSYTLDHKKNIFPCQNGQHIISCTHFECNMMFKCPLSFCIPFSYLCDGKWDCIYGYDEHNLTCLNHKPCINLFKCRQSHTCLHVHNLCDNMMHCPFHDDELLCELKNVQCPHTCNCFALAIMCTNVPYLVTPMWQKLPYHAVFIVGSESSFTKTFVTGFHMFAFLMLINNNLTSFCDMQLPLEYSVLIDLSFNRIQKISAHCFSNLKTLHLVKLNNNELSFLESFAFTNLTAVKAINLSNNYISIFNFFSMYCVLNLHISILSNNSKLSLANYQTQYLQTNLLVVQGTHLCCLVKSHTTCLAETLWSCSGLLSDPVAQKFIPACASIVIGLSFALYLLQKFSTKDSKAYRIIVKAIIFQGIEASFILFVLSITHFRYGDTFANAETKWRCSVLCSIVSIIATLYHFAVPSIFSLLSLS